MSAFVPDPSWPTLLELATELWGQPTERHRDNIRFGARGSKAVKPSTNEWFDHEANEGGGYKALWQLARPGQPLPSPRTNGETPPWLNIDVAYDYHYADGTLGYQVVRTITGEPRFLQRRPNGLPDKWIWNLKGVKRVPYRLPELIAAAPDSIIYIPEGEKDVDTLRRHGRLATCNPGGAAEHKNKAKPYHGKWLAEFSEHLRNQHIRILPDNDAPGEAHGLDIARKLHGTASSVRIVHLPGLPPKGDISDWLNVGNSIEELDRLAAQTPDYEPSPEDDDAAPVHRHTVNVLTLMRHIKASPAWDGALHFNMLTENYEICPPFPPQDGPKGASRPLHDPHDILLATMYFQANGFAKAGKLVVWDALAAAAHEHSYHPVRDYLSRLRWDGAERVGSLFRHYFNAELPNDPTERDRQVAYLEHISTGFMVGAVARVMAPGCKVDHVPVVVGRQRLLKSTAIRALCHDQAWFTDNISPNLIERDTKESLRGKWIIELAEIPHIRRESERVKVFLSSQEDRYRAAYGRASEDHPRQCVFIGTSNDLEFVDVTGNTRYWPFSVAGRIDVAAIAVDRDQVWAEALDLYRQGVQWWLPPTIEVIAAEQQAHFVETDIWEGLIEAWITNHPPPFTMEELFASGTGITPYREVSAVDKREQMRAGRCLTKLGFTKRQETINGRRAIWWRRN